MDGTFNLFPGKNTVAAISILQLGDVVLFYHMHVLFIQLLYFNSFTGGVI